MGLKDYLIEKFNLDEKRNLNHKLWEGMTLDKEVSAHLMEIAKEFISFTNCDELKVQDITITGSLANYTWHDKSDIDLHIIADVSKIKNLDIVMELFTTKKSLWNLEHDITIKEFPVELFIQLSDEPHHSSGVYSLTNKKWLVTPKKSHPSIDDSYVLHKANKWKTLIDGIISRRIDNLTGIDKLKTRLRDMRKMGLDRDGEFAVENLVFKILRKDGYIEKLYDYSSKLHDDSLSLD